MKVQHPAFPEITKDVADGEAWVAAGWIEIGSAGVAADGACPTCGATGEEPCVSKAGVETSRHAKRV